MKLLIAVCALLLAWPASGQVSLRRQGSELLRNVYMRAAVQAGCKTGRAEVQEMLDGPGSEFPVNCAARREWLNIMSELYRMAAACEGGAETVNVKVLGTELPVNCRERAADLPLIEVWLK